MTENIVAKILFIIGIAQMVAGLLFGLTFANVGYYGAMLWPIFFAWTFGGFISGMLFVGFSEVIKLLDSINGKMSYPQQSVVVDKKVTNLDDLNGEKEESKEWSSDQTNMGKIGVLYPAENIIETIPSNIDGYYLVKLQQDNRQFVRVVDISGSEAQEVYDDDLKKTIISWYNNNLI